MINSADCAICKCAFGSTLLTILIIVALNIAEKQADDDPEGVAGDSMTQSLKWQRLAMQDSDVLTRFRHLLLAQAYLNVARHFATDECIERTSRVHVRAMCTKIDKDVMSTSKQLHSRCANVKKEKSDTSSKQVSWI